MKTGYLEMLNYLKILLRINHIEKISIKSDAKDMKDCQISKIIIALYYCKLSANFLAMITQLL